MSFVSGEDSEAREGGLQGAVSAGLCRLGGYSERERWCGGRSLQKGINEQGNPISRQ